MLHAQVRQYFPLEKVTSGLFDIYQTLLGLQFTQEADADTWHDDVKLVRLVYVKDHFITYHACGSRVT